MPSGMATSARVPSGVTPNVVAERVPPRIASYRVSSAAGSRSAKSSEWAGSKSMTSALARAGSTATPSAMNTAVSHALRMRVGLLWDGVGPGDTGRPMRRTAMITRM
ncbi:MAG: hypothetical protein U0470_12400 [Anaerolineae bacterium]